MENNSMCLCSHCRGSFSYKEVRVSPDGKMYCIGCYNRAKELKAKEGKIQVADKLKVICMKCNYRFYLKKDSRIKLMCPYCGGTNLNKDRTTAECLVEDAITG